MKTKSLAIALLAVILVGSVGCFRTYGARYYPHMRNFPPTHPAQVVLLRSEPRREHIALGEVWIRPRYDMDRYYVESMLKEKAARMGADAVVIVRDQFYREGVVYNYWRGRRAVYERHIVGIAIRYQRGMDRYRR
jgi:hypothetical protein